MMLILGIVLSYLIGSIPTAYIFGKLYKGIDIRKHGSGNVGATNVFRVLGRGPGIIVLMIDVFKGILAVVVLADLLGLTEIYERIVLSLCVVSGHNWTCFLNFRGGKGIATSLGVLIGLTIKIQSIRAVLLITIFVWGASFIFSGIVSFSSVLAATVLPVAMAVTNQPFSLILLGVIFCIFVVLRHRPNIKRMLSGQEPRIFFPFKKK